MAWKKNVHFHLKSLNLMGILRISTRLFSNRPGYLSLVSGSLPPLSLSFLQRNSSSLIFLLFHLHPLLRLLNSFPLLLFSALLPNCLSFPRNEVVGTQHEGPGATQLELATEELLLHALLHRRPQPGLPFYPAGRPGWPEFNLQTTVSPGPTSGEQLCVWILLPQVYSLPCLFQMLTKSLLPAYIPQVSKVVCILFLLPELLALLSKLEPLVNSKTKQPLPSFHPGHKNT